MSAELKELLSSSETVDVYMTDHNMVVKLFKEHMPKTAALYEALTHSRVEVTGLPVPVIHEVSVIDGRWAITMDLIQGKTLAEIMKEDPANTDSYLEQMLDIQLTIHSKNVPKLSKLKDKLTRQINDLDDIDDIKKFELLSRLDSMPKHTKLCHGNFTPDNIIINENGTYILDWVAARQGNASADVAEFPGSGRTVYGNVLQEDRDLEKICSGVASYRSGRSTDRGKGIRARASNEMDRRCRIRIGFTRTQKDSHA